MTAVDISLQDLALALELQEDDLKELRNGQKGKAREDATDDLHYALQLYEAELAAYRTSVSDRSLCASIGRAVRLDADAIGAINQEEEQAASDRDYARSLSPEGLRTTPGKRPLTVPDLDEELLLKVGALQIASEEQHPAESSAWAASRPAPRTAKHAEPLLECTACGVYDSRSRVAQCPCSHEYCADCLVSLFRASLSDESLFPPRCCQQAITLDSCRKLLPLELVGEFRAKKTELETPNRTYCHQPTCSAYIPPQFIDGDLASCIRCSTRTCVLCKGSPHKGDCPQDTAAQELLRVAAENGWQRCYSCRRVVELDHGCNHMTCRCGAQFCYACGLPWKTCQCEQWREDRLLARANLIVERDAAAQRLNAAARARRLETERQNLIQNHECEHDTWRSRQGQHRCEECYDRLPYFIYECVQCRILACRRCRFNRL